MSHKIRGLSVAVFSLVLVFHRNNDGVWRFEDGWLLGQWVMHRSVLCVVLALLQRIDHKIRGLRMKVHEACVTKLGV